MDHRAGDRNALLLAARDLLGEPLRAVHDVELREQLEAAATRVARGTPFNASGSSTFSATVKVGTRLKNWKTKPSDVRRSSARSDSDIAPMSFPST